MSGHANVSGGAHHLVRIGFSTWTMRCSVGMALHPCSVAHLSIASPESCLVTIDVCRSFESEGWSSDSSGQSRRAAARAG
eukprot:14543508-Heterocapsa_arctica.AAC.1